MTVKEYTAIGRALIKIAIQISDNIMITRKKIEVKAINSYSICPDAPTTLNQCKEIYKLSDRLVLLECLRETLYKDLKKLSTVDRRLLYSRELNSKFRQEIIKNYKYKVTYYRACDKAYARMALQVEKSEGGLHGFYNRYLSLPIVKYYVDREFERVNQANNNKHKKAGSNGCA